jgi:hypothetical protein
MWLSIGLKFNVKCNGKTFKLCCETAGKTEKLTARKYDKIYLLYRQKLVFEL